MCASSVSSEECTGDTGAVVSKQISSSHLNSGVKPLTGRLIATSTLALSRVAFRLFSTVRSTCMGQVSLVLTTLCKAVTPHEAVPHPAVQHWGI